MRFLFSFTLYLSTVLAVPVPNIATPPTTSVAAIANIVSALHASTTPTNVPPPLLAAAIVAHAPAVIPTAAPAINLINAANPLAFHPPPSNVAAITASQTTALLPPKAAGLTAITSPTAAPANNNIHPDIHAPIQAAVSSVIASLVHAPIYTPTVAPAIVQAFQVAVANAHADASTVAPTIIQVNLGNAHAAAPTVAPTIIQANLGNAHAAAPTVAPTIIQAIQANVHADAPTVTPAVTSTPLISSNLIAIHLAPAANTANNIPANVPTTPLQPPAILAHGGAVGTLAPLIPHDVIPNPAGKTIDRVNKQAQPQLIGKRDIPVYTYQIQFGDTCSSIAANSNMNIYRLVTLNADSNINFDCSNPLIGQNIIVDAVTCSNSFNLKTVTTQKTCADFNTFTTNPTQIALFVAEAIINTSNPPFCQALVPGNKLCTAM